VLADLVAAAPSAPDRPVRVRRVPRAALTALSPVVPLIRELGEVLWQFDRPFRIDAAATTATFGITGTPWDEVVASTAAGWAPTAH
jgi:hypothetical protein